ncbi:MAG: hypothetical protein AAFY71_05425 [Bacteroidota bacterium]
MRIGIPGILSKFFTIVFIPLLIGGITYLVFQAFQSAYTSEAQIQVNEALWLDPYKDSTSLSREFTLNKRVQELIVEASSSKAISLLSYRLGIHDLTNAPFKSHRILKEMNETEMKEVENDLKYRLKQYVELKPDKDDEVYQMLKEMRFLPNDIRGEISITQVPGINLIQIQANGLTPDMSGFMVNTMCEEFIKYISYKETERLEDLLMVVNSRMEETKKDLDQNQQDTLSRERLLERLSDEKIWNFERRINRMESTKQQEIDRQKALKKDLERVRKKVPLDQTKMNELNQQLGESERRMEVMNQQIAQLHVQVEERETELLAPYLDSSSSMNTELHQLEKDKEKIQLALFYVDRLLIQVVKGKTRHPSPYASLLIALQSGVASLLLWVIFLGQLRVIKLFNLGTSEKEEKPKLIEAKKE